MVGYRDCGGGDNGGHQYHDANVSPGLGSRE